ncbi:hypothetical protein MMEU_1345 [Mycobacterium marinum str. Europe]|nr:hypothetical protein MMEU_1345 [Mycobacterium marinum str. Europe]
MAFVWVEADKGVNVGYGSGLHFYDLDETRFDRARVNALAFQVFGQIAA